ncbi:MAG: ATP-binding protein [Eubacterium sp.]|nr:ATP-binding protein [Eubacterium sp.]
MNIIGRKSEQQVLSDCVNSEKPEFLAVYGRRRVGKTFLIREFFNNEFTFYATGVNNVGMKEQLEYFNDSLLEYGSTETTPLKTWREAFLRLKQILLKPGIKTDPVSGKKIVFLDELPWMDTPKSGFRAALDHFWNSFGSTKNELVFIVCGSATSYIINNILGDKGGFYNRITQSIRLMPFSLKECEDFFESNRISVNRHDVILSYMVFGGIPYYLGLFNRRLSVTQNIDTLLFEQNGKLYYEYDRLFSSLFRNPGKHLQIMKELSGKGIGMTRKEIIFHTKIPDGELLSRSLVELEQCGFIRKYRNYTKKGKEHYYQVVDPFVLFCNKVLKERKISSWVKYAGTPAYHAWCGNSFEIVCLNHIREIKQILGISGIESTEYSWRSSSVSKGAQIDMLIDRSDNCINICEMKFTNQPYIIDVEYEKNLIHKTECFREETKTDKSLHLTMICSAGLQHNAHSGIITNEIDADDLFIS